MHAASYVSIDFACSDLTNKPCTNRGGVGVVRAFLLPFSRRYDPTEVPFVAITRDHDNTEGAGGEAWHGVIMPNLIQLSSRGLLPSVPNLFTCTFVHVQRDRRCAHTCQGHGR